MYDQVLTLIARGDDTTDSAGDRVVTQQRRTVFCDEHSIGSNEFWQSQADDLKPEYKLVLADFLDYGGEQLAEYKGELFKVIRTYRVSGSSETEITIGRQVNRG